MKRLLMFVMLLTAPAYAAEGTLDHDRDTGGRILPAVTTQADQLTYVLDSLANSLASRVYGSPVVYQAQRVAQAARTFAWNARYSDYRTLQGSFGWLLSQYNDLEDSIYNLGYRFDGQVYSLTAQARSLLTDLERRLLVGPTPGPNPWDQDWQCYAVDNGYEEHGGRAHAGFGRSQWEAQQDAIYTCQQYHGSCRVTTCAIIR